MTRLTRGMTVQSRGNRRVAYCVRCGWESDQTTYKSARATACDPESHECKRKD